MEQGEFFCMEEKAQPETKVQDPQKIVIEVVQAQPAEAPNTNAERKDTGVEYKYNTEYQRFCDDLGVDKYKRDDQGIAEKISVIYDWAKEQIGSEDGAAISVAVRDLIRTLGVQNIQGPLLADHLFRWIRLDMAGEQNRLKVKEKEMVHKALEMKAQIKTIDPKISEKELDTRVQAGIKDLQKQIQRKVKSHITASINKGIRDAIKGAIPA